MSIYFVTFGKILGARKYWLLGRTVKSSDTELLARLAAANWWGVKLRVTTTFQNNSITITSNGPVYKSEDGENYSFLFDGGEYIDRALCLSAEDEPPNYYFYAGDGVISPVKCKTC